MKNAIQLASVVLALAILPGCVMKTKILDTAAISMTRTTLGEGEKLKETGPVTGQFCAKTFDDKGSIGLLDESVKSAQTQYGIDYITNATFWQEGQCITVEGTGAKVVAAAAPPAAAPNKKKK